MAEAPATGTLRDIFNRLVFGDEVIIATPKPLALRSMRASLRKMKQRHNESDGVKLTGLAIKEDILIQKHPTREGASIVKLGTKTARVLYTLLEPDDQPDTQE